MAVDEVFKAYSRNNKQRKSHGKQRQYLSIKCQYYIAV